MKKDIISFAIVIIFCLPAFSQVKVPETVKTAFNERFPGATNVKWDKENSKELEANFRFNNTNVSANFGLDGSWVETETTIPADELPVPVKNAIDKLYPGAVFIQTEKLDKPDSKIFYEAHIKINGKKKELVFNQDGSMVK